MDPEDRERKRGRENVTSSDTEMTRGLTRRFMNCVTLRATSGEEKHVREMKNPRRKIRDSVTVKRLFHVIHEVAGFSLSPTAEKVFHRQRD